MVLPLARTTCIHIVWSKSKIDHQAQTHLPTHSVPIPLPSNLKASMTPVGTTIQEISTAPAALRKSIESHMASMDLRADLPSDLYTELRESGVFRMLTPLEYGGLATPLSTALTVYEDLAQIDASVGLVTWNANFGFIGALLSPEGAQRIWDGNTEPAFANSGMPGTATLERDSYRISGRWRLVSGVQHADWIVLVVRIAGSGDVPVVKGAVVHRDQITIHQAWDVTGLRGTGSHEITVEDAVVPRELVFGFDDPIRVDGDLYQGFIPTLVFPGCTAVALGVARRALTEVVELVASKGSMTGRLAEAPRVQYSIAKHESAVTAARLLLHAAVGELELAARHREPVTLSHRASLRAAMTHAAEVSREALVAAYQLASSTALFRSQPLERVFRDGMAALQHANHSALFMEAAGRARLGLDPGVPLF